MNRQHDCRGRDVGRDPRASHPADRELQRYRRADYYSLLLMTVWFLPWFLLPPDVAGLMNLAVVAVLGVIVLVGALSTIRCEREKKKTDFGGRYES